MIKIEFEGIDGSGKTTGMQHFAKYARKRGAKVIETREVGNPNIPSCVKMRELVLDPNSNLSGEAMELIFSAMRFENDIWLKKLVENAENAPDLVVSDRGYLSHVAYTDHNVSEQFSSAMYNDFVFKYTSYPDVIIYFDVSTETSLKRRTKRGTTDVIEMKGVQFQDKVRDSFKNYLLDRPSGVELFIVDANLGLEDVQGQLEVIFEAIAEDTIFT